MLGCIGYLPAAPTFAYTHVFVDGTQTISPDEVSSIITEYLRQPYLLILKRSNKFLFEKDALRERLSSRFAFESLEIQTEKHAVRVIVKEKTSQLLWISEGRTYLAARDGLVIRELAEAEKPDAATVFPSFVDLNDAEVTIGKHVMLEQEIEAIFRFHEHLRAQQIAFRETRLDREAGKWVSIVSEAGYDILIDPVQNIERQAANLETVLRESVPDPTRLEYIDLRFDDHIYYKLH